MELRYAIGSCLPVVPPVVVSSGEAAGVLEIEPGLIVKAVGMGDVRGSGVGQEKIDLEVEGVVMFRAELVTCAMWYTVGPVAREV